MDWRLQNLQKKIQEKQGRENLKQVLKTIYSSFFSTYRTFAAFYDFNEKFYIAKDKALDFCNQACLISKFFTKLDCNILFDLVKSFGVDFDRKLNIPDDCLFRSQFLEFLIRAAFNIYSKKTKILDYSAALNYCLENGLYAFLNQHNQDSWLKERLWTENCEKALEFYYPFLNNLFKKYALSTYSKNQSYMTLNEFKELKIENNIIKYLPQGEKDANLCFFLSIAKQIDELNSDRWVNLNFIEFFECLARLAEKLSLPPTIYKEV